MPRGGALPPAGDVGVGLAPEPLRVASSSVHGLVTEIRHLLARRRRVVVGLAGAPGSGKSTLAGQVCAALGTDAVLVPLDGWHLSAELTARLGASDRRGAPETFDVDGFLVLLQRIRAQSEGGDGATVYAPDFRRELEEPVAGAIAIEARTRVVVVEGNYLLLDRPRWCDVRELLDLSCFVELDPEERRRRLVERHTAYGKPLDAAARWVRGTDERNARLVEQARLAADLVVPGP